MQVSAQTYHSCKCKLGCAPAITSTWKMYSIILHHCNGKVHTAPTVPKKIGFTTNPIKIPILIQNTIRSYSSIYKGFHTDTAKRGRNGTHMGSSKRNLHPSFVSLPACRIRSYIVIQFHKLQQPSPPSALAYSIVAFPFLGEK